MELKDRKEFSTYFSLLCEVFEPDIDASRLKLLRDIYYEALKEFPLNKVKEAISIVTKTRVYAKLPKPAEILQCITGTQDEQALIAFQSLLKGIKRVGPYNDVKFQDRAIHSVIEMLGGWNKVCSVEEDQLKWMEKDFAAAYKVVVKKENHPEQLSGLHSIQNSANGHDVQVMLGLVGMDPTDKPKLIYVHRVKEITDGTESGTGVRELLDKIGGDRRDANADDFPGR